MRSFFVSPSELTSDTFMLKDEDARHAAGPLRLRVGDRVMVRDGEGGEAVCVIAAAGKNGVEVKVGERRRVSLPGFHVTLFQGLPKAVKFDHVVEKVTELGVDRVVPVMCERTVVDLKGEKGQRRRLRWRRIAEEAAKQSGRLTIPEVLEPSPLSAALTEWSREGEREGTLERSVLLVPWEEESDSAPYFSSELMGAAKRVGVVVGPEGGLTPQEVEFARSLGGVTVSLGPSILRTETAAMAAVTLALHFLRLLEEQK